MSEGAVDLDVVQPIARFAHHLDYYMMTAGALRLEVATDDDADWWLEPASHSCYAHAYDVEQEYAVVGRSGIGVDVVVRRDEVVLKTNVGSSREVVAAEVVTDA